MNVRKGQDFKILFNLWRERYYSPFLPLLSLLVVNFTNFITLRQERYKEEMHKGGYFIS
jgi:hypothetical protein